MSWADEVIYKRFKFGKKPAYIRLRSGDIYIYIDALIELFKRQVEICKETEDLKRFVERDQYIVDTLKTIKRKTEEDDEPH